MRKSLVAAAFLAGPAISALATPAMATSYSMTDAYSFTETYNAANGGPTITKILPGMFSGTIGTPTTLTNFAQFAPQATCSGGGCNRASPYPTETDPFSVTFATFTFTSGGTTATAPGFTMNGTFTAKYGGAELPCSNSGTGNTDCVTWAGASTPALPGFGVATFSEGMSNGDTLVVTFQNAEDWNITPKISFDVTVPGPIVGAGLPGLVAGCLGSIGLARRRKARHA